MKKFSKSIMVFYVLPVGVFFLSGCGNDNQSQRPYVLNSHSYLQKHIATPTKKIDIIEVQKIKSQTQKEIALINKQRDIEVQKLKQETLKTEANIKKEVEFKKSETELLMAEKSIETQKMSTILTTIISIIALMIIAYFLYKRREDKLKIHQDTINKEIYIKDRELQAQIANRLLDTLEHKKLSPQQEAKLIDTIAKTTDTKSIALIDKKN